MNNWYYAAWVTRNGQHLWSGPYRTRRQAQGALDKLLYCTGQRVLREDGDTAPVREREATRL